MARELDPDAVGASLALLRDLYRPETVVDAAIRLDRERPPSTETFAAQVARCLDELRALCELASYLEHVRFVE